MRLSLCISQAQFSFTSSIEFKTKSSTLAWGRISNLKAGLGRQIPL